MSRETSHHAPSEGARQVIGDVLDRLDLEARPAREPPRGARRAESRNGPGESGSGRSMRPSSSAARPEAVIQSFASGSAQTATAARPPGRTTRAISAAAAPISGTSISPQRQRTPSKDASSSVSDAASSTAKPTSVEAELGGAAPGGLDHLGRDVRRQQAAAGLESRVREEPRVAGACRELEDRLARQRREQLDETLRDRARRRPDQLALPLPARGDGAPGVDRSRSRRPMPEPP